MRERPDFLTLGFPLRASVGMIVGGGASGCAAGGARGAVVVPEPVEAAASVRAVSDTGTPLAVMLGLANAAISVVPGVTATSACAPVVLADTGRRVPVGLPTRASEALTSDPPGQLQSRCSVVVAVAVKP